MINRKARDEALVEEVGIKRRQLLGQKHALVDDRAARKRAYIEILDLIGDDALFYAPANDVEVELELLDIGAAAIGDHDLLDLGPRRIRLLADHVDVDRHLPPAIDGVTGIENLRFDDRAATLLRIEIGARQEDHADGEVTG